MAKILITGSADGLGLLAAKSLIGSGHQVVLHARNEERGRDAMAGAPGAAAVLTADLSSMEETKALASKANAWGGFDAVIHNAALYQVPRNSRTAEGLPLLFAVNSLAPYILTCLMNRPQRLIYMSSGMHLSGNPHLVSPDASPDELAKASYSDTKLHDLVLALVVARQWPDVFSNAVNPGWVPTKMGGKGAPDSLEKGYATQAWLAVSSDAGAKVSGRYFHHQREERFLPAAADPAVQESFLQLCAQVSGVRFPA